MYFWVNFWIFYKIFFGFLTFKNIRDGYSVAFGTLRDSNGFLDFGVDFLIFSTFLILLFNNFQNKYWYWKFSVKVAICLFLVKFLMISKINFWQYKHFNIFVVSGNLWCPTQKFVRVNFWGFLDFEVNFWHFCSYFLIFFKINIGIENFQ